MSSEVIPPPQALCRGLEGAPQEPAGHLLAGPRLTPPSSGRLAVPPGSPGSRFGPRRGGRPWREQNARVAAPLGQTWSPLCWETLPSLCGPGTPAWGPVAESRQELAGVGRPGRDGHLLGCHRPGQLGPLPGTVSAGAGPRAGLGQRAGPCQLKPGLAARAGSAPRRETLGAC